MSAVIYREAGQFKTTYVADQQIFPIRQDRIAVFARARRGLRPRALRRQRLLVQRDPDSRS